MRFLILISLYSILAFTSFFIEWENDNSVVLEKSWNDVLTDPSIKIKNILGKFGALLSHQFVHLWFGISAYFISFLFLLTGLRLIAVKILSLRKTLFNVLLALITLPVIIYHSSNSLIFSGGVGYYTDILLIGLFGQIGTSLLLITIIIL